MCSPLPSFHPGFGRSPPLMIAGGRVFVLPCIQKIQRWSYFQSLVSHTCLIFCIGQLTREMNVDRRDVSVLNAVFITSLLGKLFFLVDNWLNFLCLSLLLLRITLNTLTLNVKSDKVYTRHGVPISVTGIAQVCLNWVKTLCMFQQNSYYNRLKIFFTDS